MSSLLTYARDIRFWIILFFFMRLYGITNPPLEAAHSWRQTTVSMVARNFLEVDANILYPRIDIAGTKTGITGMEFPILNYAIYVVSKVFGYQHWYGRLINLLVSSFGVFFFFQLIRKYFNKELAFKAAFILLVSMWFAYSRKIMPDTFATSFAIMSLFYGLAFFDQKQSYKNLFLYALFGLLGLLAKVPVIFLFSIFLLPIFSSKYELKTKLLFSGISTLMLIPVFAWYLYWVPYLVNEFGFWHFFMGGSLMDGMDAVFQNIGVSMKQFYANSVKYIAFVFFLLGLGFSIKNKEKKMISMFSVLFVSFLIIVFKSGDTFVRHSYYMIPFVPIMSLFAAYGIEQLKNKKLIATILVLIAMEGVFNQQQDFWLSENQKSLELLEQDMNSISNSNDLIVINSGENPTAMYFAHRKGWLLTNEALQQQDELDALYSQGCKYVLILKTRFGTDLSLDEKLVLENKDYKIYALIRAKKKDDI